MIIPSADAFQEWNTGLSISDRHLIQITEFFGDMVAGAEALGPRYALATMALRAEYQAARNMLDRRKISPASVWCVTDVDILSALDAIHAKDGIARIFDTEYTLENGKWYARKLTS